MDWISSFPSIDEPQNVHGPNPSFTQITFPQFRQFGAAARSGWRVAIQLHFLFAGSVEREELVDISSVRIAASRSERAVEAPCMAFPPVMFIFV